MTKIAMRFVTTTDIPIGDALVQIRLSRSDYEDKTSGVIMTRLEEFHTDADGFLQVDLLPATHLYHVTAYDTVQDIAIHHDFIVPVVEDPNTILLLPDLIVPPDTVLSSLPYDEEALAKIIQAKIEAVAAALQSQASAATAVSSAATAVAAIDIVKADADKVEAWTATVDRQHTEVGGWAIQVAQNKTVVDAAVIEVNQDKDEAVNAAAGAKTSETNAANSAAAAHTDSLSATASKTAAATSATAAASSQTASANSAAAALASQTSAAQSATTATTAKNDSLSYRDQANQSAQDALAYKNSATASATSATASKDSATASASSSLTNATNAANSASAASTSAAQALASNNAAATSAANAFESARVAGIAATASQNSATASAQSAADAVATLVNKLDKADVSVAPAANKIPRAGANGAIDPAWIDTTKTSVLGKVQTNVNITVNSVDVPGIIEQLLLTTNTGGSGVAGTAIHFGYPGSTTYGSRIVGAGDPTMTLSGYTAFETGSNVGFVEKMRITGRGALLVGTQSDNEVDKLQVIGTASFDTPSSVQGTRVFQVGLNTDQRSLILFAGDGVMSGWPGTVLSVAKNSGTGRGIDTTGTVNTGGNDYAEYFFKCLRCGLIAKGQIVGITADNTITDQWADAVMFAIKSTAPSFVGGDIWANGLGSRPSPQAGPKPEYQEGMTPSDTDTERAKKQAAYAAALAAHDIAVQKDVEAIDAFDAALEVERQKVDRIAIAGRVSVNVFGAQPGDYIVPVQDGGAIKGIAVKEDDMTLRLYLRAVGQVITIEEDGRAYVMVKAV